MVNDNKKQGFTLVEGMIILLFASLLVAAMMPMLSKKYRSLQLKLNHGQYVCTIDNDGAYYEILKKDKNIVYSRKAPGGICTFVPPTKVSFFSVQAIGGGGGGNNQLPTNFTNYYRIQKSSTSNISTQSPSLEIADWPSEILTESVYNSNAGNVTIKLKNGCGGQGGNAKAWVNGTIYNFTGGLGANNSSTTGTNTQYTYCVPEQMYTSAIFPLKYRTTTQTINVYPTKGYNGTNNTADVATQEALDDAKDGFAGQNGKVTLTYSDGSTSSVVGSGAIQNGGGKATKIANGTNYQIINVAGYTISSDSDVVERSPAILEATRYYYSKYWYRGLAGTAGKYNQKFVVGLKKNLPITIGKGGAFGSSTYTCNGETTTFGDPASPIAQAAGGEGCKRMTSATLYEIGKTPTTDEWEYVTEGENSYTIWKGEEGSSPTTGLFTLLEGLNLTPPAMDSNYGKGGNGLSTISYCNSGELNYLFNGSTIKTVEPTCSDYNSYSYMGQNHTYSYAIDPYKYTGYDAIAGRAGAVIITW